MKKFIKLGILVIFIAIIAILFIGRGDKVKATRIAKETIWGECKIKLEISFKEDKIDNVIMVYELEDEMRANEMIEFRKSLLYGNQEIQAEFEQQSNKVTIECNAEGFCRLHSEQYRDLNKEETLNKLKEEGYEIK